jgi:predicted dehydrogenase
MIKIGIVGFGYWGPNLVRNFSMQNDCIVKAIADKRLERLNIVKKSYPDVKTVQDVGEIINDPEIDAVVIATPVSSHYTLAKMALLKGKHVLVEKPFTSSVDEAKELIDIAFNLGKVIMVDHTFLYTGAVNKMRSLIVNGEIGELKYFDSTRVNLGLFQSDINVLWDLAPHDLSILNYLVEERPISVMPQGYHMYQAIWKILLI